MCAREEKRNITKNPFQIFRQLQNIDLSANGMTQFPTELNALTALKELNLMNNDISVVPQSFFGSHVRNTLRSLVLNQNPLRELDPSVEQLQKLRVLGIAQTEITKLPQQITKLRKLKEIYVNDTPLKQPKLALAQRGIEAIKEFFH